MLPHLHSLWEDLPLMMQFRLHRTPLPHAPPEAMPGALPSAAPSVSQLELDLPPILVVYDHGFLRQLLRFFGTLSLVPFIYCDLIVSILAK